MNNKFKLIECNDDVVSFNGSLVKFAKFKEILENEFNYKIKNIYGKENQYFNHV